MSRMGQLEDNLKTFGDFQPLNEKESAEIEDIVKELRSRVQNGCTGCRYLSLIHIYRDAIFKDAFLKMGRAGKKRG